VLKQVSCRIVFPNQLFMKQTKTLHDKNSLVEQISKFFDKEKVEQVARETKFVQRESKLDGMIFFSLCVYSQEGSDHKFGRFMQRITDRRH
jgi:hypothetical protein